jgi:hypothetical protein
MSSRIVRSSAGRALWVIVTAPSLGLDTGTRLVVLGDSLPPAEVGFSWLGVRTGRPPLLAETPRRNGTAQTRREPPRKWTDAHREEAHRLQLKGVSWSQIAERVCGDKRYKGTVGVWLKRDEIPVDH